MQFLTSSQLTPLALPPRAPGSDRPCQSICGAARAVWFAVQLVDGDVLMWWDRLLRWDWTSLFLWQKRQRVA